MALRSEVLEISGIETNTHEESLCKDLMKLPRRLLEPALRRNPWLWNLNFAMATSLAAHLISLRDLLAQSRLHGPRST